MIDASPSGRAFPRRPLPMAVSQRDAQVDAAVDLFASTWKLRAEGRYPTYSEFRRAVVFSIARQLSTSLAAAATLYNLASQKTRRTGGLVETRHARDAEVIVRAGDVSWPYCRR